VRSAPPRNPVGSPPRSSAEAERAAHELASALAPGVEASPLPTAVATIDGRFLLANPPYCRLVGRRIERLRELSVADVTAPEDFRRQARALAAIARGRLRHHEMRKRYLRPDGRVVEAVTYVAPVRAASGEALALLGHVLEAPGSRTRRRRPLAAERSFDLLFSANPEPMWIYDLETLRILEVNEAASAHYGWSREEFLSLTIEQIRPPEELPRLRAYLAEGRLGLERSGPWRHRCADGRVIEVEVTSHEIPYDGRRAVLVCAHDVTERNLLERELMHRALHDPVTGLPNRALFLHEVDQMLADASAGPVGVLCLELEGFHLLNESLGHEAGEAVLATIGQRIRSALGPGAAIGSVGGDQLALCASGLEDPGRARAFARRVQAVVAEPLVVADRTEVSLACTVGAALAEPGSADGLGLLRDALSALGAAKQTGPGRVAVFSGERTDSGLARLSARQDLRRALERGEIVAHYQPVVSLGDRRIVGAEALARWQHRSLGLVMPAEFVPLAEETGLVGALGRTVLEQACRHATAWCPGSCERGDLVVSVNVSGRQLRDGRFARLVERVLGETGLRPERLALELTETVLVDRSEAVEAELAALKELGVRLSLDDFGTGYSSLTSLDRLPLDLVKVDRSFVSGIEQSPRHLAIVSAVVALCRQLGLEVVAEGVETEAEAQALASLGVDKAQGYLFFRPMAEEALRRLLC
jgi:diguanylate cyclase (GGDEF)-like protein/PAS domain S-box-containing protein